MSFVISLLICPPEFISLGVEGQMNNKGFSSRDQACPATERLWLLWANTREPWRSMTGQDALGQEKGSEKDEECDVGNERGIDKP